jgi:hypothetical protein
MRKEIKREDSTFNLVKSMKTCVEIRRKKDYKAIKLFNSLLRNFEISFKLQQNRTRISKNEKKRSGLKQQSSLFIMLRTQLAHEEVQQQKKASKNKKKWRWIMKENKKPEREWSNVQTHKKTQKRTKPTHGLLNRVA